MPLLKEVADMMSQEEMEAGVVEELIERDDLFAILPFVRINSKAYVYHREDVAGAIDDNGFAWTDPNDVVPEGAAEFDEITTRLRILIGDVDVDNFLQEVESDTNDQTALQLAAKAKKLGRQYHKALAEGDAAANPKQFDGIKALTVNTGSNPEQTIEAGENGAALTLSMLDELLDAVPNGADVIVMRKGTARAFRQLLRAAGGTSAAEYMMEAFGRPMLTHNGVPIIVNDFMSGAEEQGTNVKTCSIYALRANEIDGLHGLYGGDKAGIRLESVGTVQNKDAKRMRLKWYCGLALKSTKSLARLKGITNI